jgi:hypothetical protein
MYLTTLQGLPEDSYMKFNGIIGNWLLAAGLPLLHRTKDEFYFMKTSKLLQRLEDLPFYYQILYKMS